MVILLLSLLLFNWQSTRVCFSLQVPTDTNSSTPAPVPDPPPSGSTAKLFSLTGLAKSMDQRIRLLHHQRTRLVSIHVHVPKAGGTALAYALASSCNCSQKHTLSKDTSNVCSDCRRVLVRHKTLPGWVRFPCTFSRVTGWPCGIAHAPLALLRILPYCTGQYTIEQRGKPVYIIMLRDPWKRFVSEWRTWGGYRLSTLDWSAVSLPPNKNLSFPYWNHSQIILHPAIPKMPSMRASLEDMIALPESFILHNRYIKMIGGESSDFFFNFSRETIGSRWVGRGDKAETDRIYARALFHLQRSPNVLPLLQDRFQESLCILEVVLGSQQRFDWEDKRHAHGAAYTITDSLHTPSPRYADWALKNAADLKLYNDTQIIFEVQLGRALLFLRDRIRAAKGGKGASRLLAVEAPHCESLSQWRALVQ